MLLFLDGREPESQQQAAARLGIDRTTMVGLLDSLEGKGYANITRYPSTPFPGIARNAYGLLGSASVLYEARGDMGQASNGMIAKQTEVAGMGILRAAADGSLWTRDTTPADTIRERGPFVPDPHE